MEETRVLLVFPGSLYGGHWADGPRVKPELVGLSSELRRAGYAVDVLDLEVELGQPGDDAERAAFLDAAGAALAARPADLVVVSCWSALQYSAAVAVAERTREAHPNAVIAVEGHQVSVRPNDFNDPGAPFDWLIVGEAESAVLTIAHTVATGERETGTCHSLEGRPLDLTAEHLPDYGAYPYTAEGLPELSVFLSRGCPYNAPACLLRPGGGGWHAFPPHVAVAILTSLAELRPSRLDVLDPAFGYDPVWRHAVLEGLAASDRRDLALTVAGRPADLQRRDVDALYRARVRLRLDVGTLSRELLSRTGQAPRPADAVEHALDLLAYANAKGLLTVASFTFNQPGETEASAAETLDALASFVGGGAQRVRLGAGAILGFPPGRRAGGRHRRPGAQVRHAHRGPGVVEVGCARGGRREGGRGQRRARASAARRRELLAAAFRGAARGPGREADVRGAARAAQPRDGGVRGLRRAARLVVRAALALNAARTRHATRARLPRPAPAPAPRRHAVCLSARAGWPIIHRPERSSVAQW